MKQEAVRTLRLAGPIIIGELAQLLLHILDTAMVGQVSYRHIAASSLVVNVINIPFVLGIGATIAVSQLVSMAKGRNDDRAVSHYLFNGFIMSMSIALLIAIALLCGKPLLSQMGQDPAVVRLAQPFLTLMAWSILPMILFLCLKHFADGLEHPSIPMTLSILALPVNAFLNWLLIYGNLGFPRLELSGAGWATLITRCVLFVTMACVVLFHRHFRPYRQLAAEAWKLRLRSLQALLYIAIPSGLQIGLESAAFAATGILIGTLGAIPQAAHQIALSIVNFTFMIALGLAQAGSIRTSHAYGSGNWVTIRTIGKSTGIMALGYGLFCALAIVLLHRELPLIFNENSQVVHLAATLLMLAAVFQVSDSTQVCGASLLRGVKDTRVPTLLVAIAYWVVGIPVGYVMAFVFGMGAPGMWLGLILGLSFASLLLWSRFRKISRDPSVGRQFTLSS